MLLLALSPTSGFNTVCSQLDEWTSRFPTTLLPGEIVRGTEIWCGESFQQSVFYNEFLKRVDVCEMAGVLASRSNNFFEFLSVYRGPREGLFEREQFSILELIAPHLQTALAIRRRLLALESRISDMETALDGIGTALVLLDAEARPILANRAARQICDQRNGLHLSTIRLSAQSPTENSRLREIVSKAILAGRSKSLDHSGAMLVSRLDKRPLQVLAAPFISRSLEAPNGAVAVVFISDPEQKPSLRSEVLRELYGLTRAEARLAISLLDGKPLAETAELIGVSHETVRSQMKSVLHKTGTERQGNLIHLLSNLPGFGS